MYISEMKMNNQEIERFEHHVGDMYNILINISSELNTIKSMMQQAKTENLEDEKESQLESSDSLLLISSGATCSNFSSSTGNGALPSVRFVPPNFDLTEKKTNNLIGKHNVTAMMSNNISTGNGGSGNGSCAVGSCPGTGGSALTHLTGMELVSSPPHSHKMLQPHNKFKLDDAESTVGHMTESASGRESPNPMAAQFVRHFSDSVTLNVGGKRHEVRWDTLDKFPNSRLGRLRHCVTHRGVTTISMGIQELCDSYNLPAREYYFDRSPRNFDAILGLYRTGKLHLSQGVCVQDFCEELEYWGLCDLHLEPCCQHTYYRARWLLPELMNVDENMDEYFGIGFFGNLQHKLWNLLENPNSSFAAKIVAVTSCMFVVASTFSLIISTLPMFQVQNKNGKKGQDEEHVIFAVGEAIFVGWFTFEYIVRFIAAPQKWKFVKATMNVIDVLGVLPYFLSMGLSIVNRSTGVSEEESAPASYQDEMMRIAQIFRIMRILRIFKLARHITGLQTLGFTLKNSYKELGLLMLVVIMGMLIFSGLAYVSEKNEEDTRFISMPQALYWAIITMTSVGYGDICPTTWFGKLVGSACAICGVLCISLPIPIIVNNFNKFYEKAKIEEEIEVKRKKTSWEDAKRDLMDARRKSCIVAASDWKKLFKGSAQIQRPSVPTISEGGGSCHSGMGVKGISMHSSEPINVCPMVETNYGGTIPNPSSNFGSASTTTTTIATPSTILVNNLSTHVRDTKKY